MTQEMTAEMITVTTRSKTERELIQKIHGLDETTQQAILDYIGALVISKRPEGIKGEDAIRLAREINFDAESLREMQEAIEEFFEGEAIIEDVKLDE